MSDWQLVDSSFCGSGDGDDEPERSVSRQSVSRTKAELSMDDWSDMQDDEADVSSLPGQGSSTQRRVLRDLREIRLMLDSFIVSDCDFGGGTRIWLRVGWPVKLLELNDEQCAAWGLDNGGNLMVELRCPPHYFSSDRRQISIHVGLCSDTAAPRAEQPLTQCRLSWPLEHAIRTHFLPELPLALEEAGYELGMVQDLLAHTDGEYAAAIRALQATGSDMHAAVQLIKRQRQTAETVSCALLEAKEADDEFELVSPPSPSSPPDTPSTPPATSAAAESDSSAASSQTPTAALSHVQVVAADDDEKPAAPLAAASKTEGESDDEELWIDEEVQAAPLSVHARLRVGDSTASTVPMGWPSEYQVVTRKEQSVISGVLAGPGFACTPFMAKRALELSDDIVSAAVQLVLDMRQLLQDEESMAATATDFRQIIDHPPPPQHAVSSPASAIAVAAPVSALVAAPAASVSSTDLVLIPSDEQELLRLLSPHNLLVRLLSFTWRQVQQLPSSCANCGAALHPGLSMRSCGLATCKLSIDSSGVDTDVIDYMRRAPAVSDLLISMLAAAASDQQLPAAVAPLMFSVRDPEFCYVDSFASEHSPGRLDYLRLQHSISQLQSLPVMLSDVSSLGEEEFVSKTNSLDLLIIPLLRWLFLSCPAHLRLLETGAHYQYPVPLVALFACLLNSPEQERAFQQRKAAASGRSCLAYYTAPAAQWHTKLRLGLTARTANGGVVESRPDDTVLLSLQPPEVTDFFPCAWQRSYLTQWPAFVCEVEVLESARRLPGSPGHVAARQEDFSSRRLLILAHSTAAGSNVFALRRCGSSSSSSSPSLASPAPVDESSSPPPGYKPLPQHEIRTGWDD